MAFLCVLMMGKNGFKGESKTTIRKIATTLDVSLDELTNDPYKTPELYELYWAIPREIKNPDIQGMTFENQIYRFLLYAIII